jgi:RNA polymerase sigma factor (TIGR02999 family)
MDDTPASQITAMLEAVGKGDKQAADELLPLLYDELRSLASARLDAPGQTPQPTALVHEAHLKLTAGTDPGWNGRSHFFAAAALAMRHTFVDQARRKARIRLHGGRHGLEVEPADPGALEPDRGARVAIRQVLAQAGVESGGRSVSTCDRVVAAAWDFLQKARIPCRVPRPLSVWGVDDRAVGAGFVIEE